jgi:threonine dehydratase
MMNVRQEALQAEKRIRAHIRETPVEHSLFLSRLGNCEVFLKLENAQLTGSFKLRGAMNKILSLSRLEAKRGVVTASSGNHGMAVAYLTKKFGIKSTIILPEIASNTKIEALRAYGADIYQTGDDCVKAESFARETAGKKGIPFISPYNDPQIIGGQGIIGIELIRQLGGMDVVLAPVGGGGLICGISGYVKSELPDLKAVGCQPINSPVMYESIKAGKVVEMESLPTISDGTTGGIEPGTITLDLCKRYVDDFILLSEQEIIEAIKLILEKHYLLIEGAAALPVAAFIKQKERFRGKTVVLIISGAKISLNQLEEIIFKGERK